MVADILLHQPVVRMPQLHPRVPLRVVVHLPLVVLLPLVALYPLAARPVAVPLEVVVVAAASQAVVAVAEVVSLVVAVVEAAEDNSQFIIHNS